MRLASARQDSVRDECTSCIRPIPNVPYTTGVRSHDFLEQGAYFKFEASPRIVYNITGVCMEPTKVLEIALEYCAELLEAHSAGAVCEPM